MTKAITTRYAVRREKAGHVASDGDGNSVFVQTDNSSANDIEHRHLAAALALCAKMKWRGSLAGAHLLKGGKTVGMVWVWTGADPAIQAPSEELLTAIQRGPSPVIGYDHNGPSQSAYDKGWNAAKNEVYVAARAAGLLPTTAQEE